MFVVFPSMYMDLGFAKVLTDSGQPTRRRLQAQIGAF